MVTVIQYSRDIKSQDASCIFCIADVDIENHAMMLADTLKGKVKTTLGSRRWNSQAIVVVDTTWLLRNLRTLRVDTSRAKSCSGSVSSSAFGSS
jgi:hypothetical protein